MVKSIFHETLHHFTEYAQQCDRVAAHGQVGFHAWFCDWNDLGKSPRSGLSALLRDLLKQLAKDKEQGKGRF